MQCSLCYKALRLLEGGQGVDTNFLAIYVGRTFATAAGTAGTISPVSYAHVYINTQRMKRKRSETPREKRNRLTSCGSRSRICIIARAREKERRREQRKGGKEEKRELTFSVPARFDSRFSRSLPAGSHLHYLYLALDTLYSRKISLNEIPAS